MTISFVHRYQSLSHCILYSRKRLINTIINSIDNSNIFDNTVTANTISDSSINTNIVNSSINAINADAIMRTSSNTNININANTNNNANTTLNTDTNKSFKDENENGNGGKRENQNRNESRNRKSFGEIILMGLKASAITGTLICSLGLLTGNLNWFLSSSSSNIKEQEHQKEKMENNKDFKLLSNSQLSSLEHLSYNELLSLYNREIENLTRIMEKESSPVPLLSSLYSPNQTNRKEEEA